MGPWQGAFVGAVISLILALIFIPLLQDKVNDILVDLLSGPFGLRKGETLSGIWDQDWQVDEDLVGVIHADKTMKLSQFGRSIVGSFKYGSRTYRIRARIENSTYINGVWFDEKSGQVYHGTFQARIEVNSNEVNGKWIGFSRTHNRINTGDWHWIRRAEPFAAGRRP